MIEFHWIQNYSTQKEALQGLLNCSGQLLKKHFSSKDLNRPVRAKDRSRLPLDLVNHMMINPIYTGPQAQILKETENYLVVHKPAQVHSHPHAYSDQDTLLNFLATQGEYKTLSVNSSSYDRGLLYRLDFETSGIMLVAKNDKYFEEMRTQFREKMKSKYYWAIVEGDFNQEGFWTHYFRGSGAKGSKQKVETFSFPDSDMGELEVKKVLYENGKSLVLVNLSHGLRHQIRAQLAVLGFPILGDELYGGTPSERLYLHALRYEWDEIEEDSHADLFDRFFDLNRGLKMSHDMFSVFKRR